MPKKTFTSNQTPFTTQIPPALPACLVKGCLVVVALYVLYVCLYVQYWAWELSPWRIFASGGGGGEF